MKLLAPAAVLLLSACGGRVDRTVSDTASMYIDAVGGRRAVESIQTVHTLDSLHMAGLSGTSESWWQKDPFRGRVVVQLGPVSQEMIIQGDSVWSIDRNGVPAPGDEMTRSQALLAAGTVFYDSFLDTTGLSAGTDTTLEGGQRVCRLVLTIEGLDPVTFFLSRESGLPVMIHASVMGIDVYSSPGDWTEVSGILSAGSTSDRIPALGQESDSRNILTEYNVPIPEQVFAILGGDRDWSLESPGEAFPFVLDGEHIYLKGQVGGRDAEFLLDSGAGATVIDSALAAALGLEQAGSFSALGVAGSSSFSFVQVPGYGAAGATLTDQTLASMPLDAPFYPLTGHHIGMIVGYDFLSRFVTLIDYGARTITLYDPASFELPADASVIPASRTMGVLSVGATIEDSIPARLLLDTGAGGALHLSNSFLAAHPAFLAGRDTVSSFVEGVGGEEAATLFRVGSVSLGGYRVEAGLSSAGTGGPVLAAFDGILGTGVLARFRIFLDYQGQRVALQPSSMFEIGLPDDMTGLGVEVAGEGLLVRDVIAGSPADSAGILTGDTLVSIRGSVPGPDPGVLDSLLSGPEGSPVTLEIGRPDGRHEVTIELGRILPGPGT